MQLNNDLVNFLAGTLILMLFAFTLVIFLIVHKKKRYEHLLEKQQMENTYQTQLLQSRLEVQEQSFRYFSEEIHDNIGQLLSIVKMQLYNIRNSSHEDDIVHKASDCNELLGKAITDLRNISHSLNSGYVSKAGLADAVEKDMEYIRSAKDIKCTLHPEGDERSLGTERELMVFRIIQEAVGNAVKHAAPSAIDVFLNYKDPNSFCVTIADNGSGFDTRVHATGGIGLSNMQVRARLLNGNIDVISAKDQGTKVILSINH